MNTLCNDLTDRIHPVVEAFLYCDTLGPPMASQLPAEAVEPGQDKGSKGDKAARISQEEMSRLTSAARVEGFAEGERQSAARLEEELSQERKRVADSIAEFQQQRTDYYSKVEIELVHLALAIAAKILHRESQVDRMVVAGLVKVAVERLGQKTKIVVRVRPEDADSWKHYFCEMTNLAVVEDSALEPKACLLETELGTADLGLDAQLKEVEKGFFDLLAQRPEPK
jgi:flagellar biosynthesis/type III secretory pathway protein FliH